jgi:hypothetical protein
VDLSATKNLAGNKAAQAVSSSTSAGWEVKTLENLATTRKGGAAIKTNRFKAITKVIGMALLFRVFDCALASEFEADGKLTITGFPDDGEPKILTEYEFQIAVNGSAWRIRTAVTNATERNPPEYFEVSSPNGRELYYFTKFPSNLNIEAERLGKRISESIPINIGSGIIESNSIPRNLAGNQVETLWLAFVSGPFLDNLDENVMPAMYNLGMGLPIDFRTNFVKSAVQRLDSNPSLPKEIVFITDKLFAGPGPNNTASYVTPPVPFITGFTNATYVVAEYTNVNSWKIPVSASLNIFLPRYETKDRKRVVLRRVASRKLVVTALRKGTAVVEWTPQFQGVAIVDDERFARRTPPISSIRMNVTDGNWPKSDSSKLVAILPIHARMEEVARVSTRNSSPSVLLWILLATAAVVVSTLLFINRK